MIMWTPKIIKVIEYYELVGNGNDRPFRRLKCHVDFKGNVLFKEEDTDSILSFQKKRHLKCTDKTEEKFCRCCGIELEEIKGGIDKADS